MTETLNIQPDIAELERVAEWMDVIEERLALPHKTRFAIDLCLEEALSNIIRHGFSDGWHGTVDDRAIRVGLAREGDVVTVTIEDRGTAFDPRDTPAPPRPTKLAETTIGGLGVHLMRHFTRQMDYQRRDDTNRLTLQIGLANAAQATGSA